MITKYIYGSLLLFSLFFLACSKSNEADEMNNAGVCDTANMLFAKDIFPIIQANCWSCHSNANMAISGVSLAGYPEIKAKADEGKLIGSITHATGYAAMPQGASKLPDCTINKIKSWVNSGAKNN